MIASEISERTRTEQSTVQYCTVPGTGPRTIPGGSMKHYYCVSIVPGGTYEAGNGNGEIAGWQIEDTL